MRKHEIRAELRGTFAALPADVKLDILSRQSAHGALVRILVGYDHFRTAIAAVTAVYVTRAGSDPGSVITEWWACGESSRGTYGYRQGVSHRSTQGYRPDMICLRRVRRSPSYAYPIPHPSRGRSIRSWRISWATSRMRVSGARCA